MTIHLFRYPGILPQRQRTHEDLDFAVFNHSYPDVVAEGEPTIDNGAKTASVATASKNELGRQAGSSGMPLSKSASATRATSSLYGTGTQWACTLKPGHETLSDGKS